MSSGDLPANPGSSFADRYALLGLDDGGVLVDLASGAYLALNISAAAVCAALAVTTDPSVVVAEVCRRLHIGPDEASRAVAEVRQSLETHAPRNGYAGAFRYERAPKSAGYVLIHEERVRLEIADDGSLVEIATGGTQAQIYEYLRAAAPRSFSSGARSSYMARQFRSETASELSAARAARGKRLPAELSALPAFRWSRRIFWSSPLSHLLASTLRASASFTDGRVRSRSRSRRVELERSTPLVSTPPFRVVKSRFTRSGSSRPLVVRILCRLSGYGASGRPRPRSRS